MASGTNKRGVSDVVVVVLIIFIGIAAVMLVWLFLSSYLRSADIRAQVTALTLPANIKSALVAYPTSGTQTMRVAVSRGAGAANVTGVRFVMTNDAGATFTHDEHYILGELESKVFTFNVLSSELAPKIVNVEIALLVTDDTTGTEVSTQIKDEKAIDAGTGFDGIFLPSGESCYVQMDVDEINDTPVNFTLTNISNLFGLYDSQVNQWDNNTPNMNQLKVYDSSGNVLGTYGFDSPRFYFWDNFDGNGYEADDGVTVTNPNETDGVLVVDGVSILSGSELDLGRDSMVVRNGNYTQLYAWIKSGYNGGLWNGSGIGTRKATAQNGKGLGIMTGSLYNILHPISKLGNATVSSSDVVIMYTYMGDATLDGKITAEDYAQYTAGFSMHTGIGWINGNFNYDYKVDYQDKAVIDSAFAAQSSGVVDEDPLGGIGESSEGVASIIVPYFSGIGKIGVQQFNITGAAEKQITVDSSQIKCTRTCKIENEIGSYSANDVCCSGFVPVQQSDDTFVCTTCGDNVCSANENSYVCPEDCPLDFTCADGYQKVGDGCEEIFNGTYITQCGALSIPGMSYRLNNTIVMSGSSCIYINASGVTLDGNGYSIVGSYSSISNNAYAVIVRKDYNFYPDITNITLKNLIINVSMNVRPYSSYAIAMAAYNSAIVDSTIVGSVEEGIAIGYNNNRVDNVEIVNPGSWGIHVSWANSVEVSSVNIRGAALTGYGGAIYTESSQNVNIHDNTLDNNLACVQLGPNTYNSIVSDVSCKNEKSGTVSDYPSGRNNTISGVTS